MDATQAEPNARRNERHDHAAGLTLAATRLLRAGRPREAFELANRRCRLDEAPGPADWAIRAIAGRLCGWTFWREDLANARRADPLDLVVNTTMLRLGTDEEKRTAALAIVSVAEASATALEDALRHLFAIGERAATRLDLVDNRLSGWVSWQVGEGADEQPGPWPVLEIEGRHRTHRIELPGDGAISFLPDGVRGALVEALLPFENVRRFVLRLDGEALGEGVLVARSRRGDAPSPHRPPPSRTPARAPLVVLVPVYGDLQATKACLDAASAEVSGRADRRLVVVDDASPDPGLVRHLAQLAADGTIELIANEVNLGFSGAVRRGLAKAGGCDVLLLNADALLPAGALDRLADVAYGAPDIGTVTPLSNNGEYTSFPRPGLANPAPSPDEAARIDAAAARLALAPVDLPTGTGFCLYLRHDCRAALGEMPAIYGRGYFEDMELCLRARECGYRSVCAPSVFAVHHGSLSFGAEKGALVSRNLRILRQRFPGIRETCAAHAKADPLRAARAALEAELGPMPGLPLLVAREGGALVAERLARLDGNALRLLWSAGSGRPQVRLVGPNGAAPQSLDIPLDPAGAALGRHLAGAAIERIEILGADEPPAGLVAALQATNAPIDLVLGDVPLALPPPGEGPAASPFLGPLWRLAFLFGGRLRHVVAAERQSFTVLGRGAASLPPGMTLVDGRIAARTPQPSDVPPGAPPSIGILSPEPLPAVDAFVRALSAVLHRRRSAARLVVLGRAVDAPGQMARGNVFVTGPVPMEEEGDILRLHAIAALVLPPASPFLAEAERIADRYALPLAAADWTFGHLSPRSLSLLLDPHARDAGNALAIADGFAHRLEAAAP